MKCRFEIPANRQILLVIRRQNGNKTFIKYI